MKLLYQEKRDESSKLLPKLRRRARRQGTLIGASIGRDPDGVGAIGSLTFFTLLVA
jgi:hypothetical protein